MKLRTDETDLVGEWLVVDGSVVADAVCLRIETLVSSWLVPIGRAADGWDRLYRDPADGRKWELTYPQSESHGGGPPRLRLFSSDDERIKYRHVALQREHSTAGHSAEFERLAADLFSTLTGLLAVHTLSFEHSGYLTIADFSGDGVRLSLFYGPPEYHVEIELALPTEQRWDYSKLMGLPGVRAEFATRGTAGAGALSNELDLVARLFRGPLVERPEFQAVYYR